MVRHAGRPVLIILQPWIRIPRQSKKDVLFKMFSSGSNVVLPPVSVIVRSRIWVCVMGFGWYSLWKTDIKPPDIRHPDQRPPDRSPPVWYVGTKSPGQNSRYVVSFNSCHKKSPGVGLCMTSSRPMPIAWVVSFFLILDRSILSAFNITRARECESGCKSTLECRPYQVSRSNHVSNLIQQQFH